MVAAEWISAFPSALLPHPYLWELVKLEAHITYVCSKSKFIRVEAIFLCPLRSISKYTLRSHLMLLGKINISFKSDDIFGNFWGDIIKIGGQILSSCLTFSPCLLSYRGSILTTSAKTQSEARGPQNKLGCRHAADPTLALPSIPLDASGTARPE